MSQDGSTALNGRNGKLVYGGTTVARLTKWDVNKTLATKSEWGDSDSAGYTNRVAGRKDATFDTEGKFDNTNEQFDILEPEDIATGILWMGSGGSNPSDLYWHFPRALCLDFKLSVNVDSEEVIGWTSGFGADGIFYRPGQSGAPAAVFPGTPA